nr:AraC family transcriptional regulator [uncultured Allomuricauda sp.]
MKETVNRRIGDPSTNKQSFTDVKLKILCCRYWKLDLWDCHDMAFPFWRIYWNKNKGGLLQQGQNTYAMDPKSIYIISPFTSFSTRFSLNHSFDQGVNVYGRSITASDNEDLISKSALLHLFVHFNLGVPFDNVYPGVFPIKASDDQLKKLNYLTEKLKLENTKFYATYTLKLQSIINDILSNIGPELFETLNVDFRILDVIRYIENHLQENPTNSDMADIANMATNSFSRLFRQKMNTTLHKFIMKRKIAHSCELFLHTNKSIQEVAFTMGFSDRYHFSRVFKLITGTTPAVYKSGKFS